VLSACVLVSVYWFSNLLGFVMAIMAGYGAHHERKNYKFPVCNFFPFPPNSSFLMQYLVLAFLCFVKNIGELIDIFKIISIVSGYNKFVAAMLIIENAVFLVCFIFRYNFD
jgi:hypothetical protein